MYYFQINMASSEVKRFLGLVDPNIILNYAAKHGYPELVVWAVDEAEADIAAIDALRNPPIITAALAGHLEVVQFLDEVRNSSPCCSLLGCHSSYFF